MRAWQVIEAKQETSHCGWYYNLSTWKNSRARKAFPFPSTPPTLLIADLHASLNRILNVETLQGHWDRYCAAQQRVRAELADLGFVPLAADDVASPTVSCIYKHPSMDAIEDLRDYLLAEHNILIATGGGPLTGQIARIGHMGLAGTDAYVGALVAGVRGFLAR
ncbi:MAG: hypothetical protein R2873_26490 [Caldilineaceae bacterium]